LYPNPTTQPLREKLAKHHGCKPENIVVGNGSDELLALAARAFVEPADRGLSGRSGLASDQGADVSKRPGASERAAAWKAAVRSDATVQ